MKSFRTIAVGFDGSDDSEIALRWAVRLAADTGAEVVVVHATGMLEHLDTHFSADKMPTALATIAGEYGVDVKRLHWIVDNGDACSVLLRASEPPVNADLLVVGSRGHGKRPGLLLGSTSLEVTQHATTPVVVVPSNVALH
jgi:nucleotide-binding universal stress UspA family protein